MMELKPLQETRATVISHPLTLDELRAALDGSMLNARAEQMVGPLIAENDRLRSKNEAQRDTINYYRKHSHHRSQEAPSWDAILLGGIIGSMLTATLFGTVQAIIDVSNVMMLLIGVYMFGSVQGYFGGRASLRCYRGPGAIERIIRIISKKKEATS